MKLHKQLSSLRNILSSRAAPKSRDEVVNLIAEALLRAFDDIRVLFYLAPFPQNADPLSLLPCPSRRVSSGVFLFDGDGVSRFTFETPHSYYVPIRLASVAAFGVLFLETPKYPLDASDRILIELLAAQTAHHFDHLRRIVEVAQPSNKRFEIDTAGRQVWVDGAFVQLSPNELALMQCFYRHGGRLCKRDEIFEAVYVDEKTLPHGREARLDVLVSKLRRKLRAAFGEAIVIETVRGAGYRLKMER